MATVARFEELGVWQRARQLSRTVYALTGSPGFADDRALSDQMRRAVISIASNVAEGFERGGRGEFVQFLSVAKGSAGELRAQLYLALDQQYLTQAQFEESLAMTEATAAMLAGLMRYLKCSPIKGDKYNRTNGNSTAATLDVKP